MLQVGERKCHRTRGGNLRRKNRRGAAPGGLKGRLKTQHLQRFLGGRSFKNFFFSPRKIYFPHFIIFWQEQGGLRACSSVFSILLHDLIFHGHQGLERTSVRCFHKSKMCSKFLNALGTLRLQTLRQMMHDNACLYIDRLQIQMLPHVKPLGPPVVLALHPFYYEFKKKAN